MTEILVNDVETTLAAGIDADDTTLTVTSAAGMPSTGDWRVWVGDPETGEHELMLVTARTGTSLTVTRGIESTTAAPRSSGDTVAAVLTAGGFAAAAADSIGDERVVIAPGEISEAEEAAATNPGDNASLRVRGREFDPAIGQPAGTLSTAVAVEDILIVSDRDTGQPSITLVAGPAGQGFATFKAAVDEHSGIEITEAIDENFETAGDGTERALRIRGIGSVNTFLANINGSIEMLPQHDTVALTIEPQAAGRTEDILQLVPEPGAETTVRIDAQGRLQVTPTIYTIGPAAGSFDIEWDNAMNANADSDPQLALLPGGLVCLEGIITFTGACASFFFTAPTALRPSAPSTVVCYTTGAEKVTLIEISPDGTFYVHPTDFSAFANNDQILLSGTYRAG